MSKLTENPNIPQLTGWIKLSDAGERLGLTRQYISRLATQGGFKTLHRIGEGATALFVVEEYEVENLARARAEQQEKPAEENSTDKVDN